MVDEQKDFKNTLRGTIFKVFKATIKGVLFYAAYYFLTQFLAPIPEIAPGFQPMIETFVMAYITLMILGEVTSGTIFHHFFETAKSLFVVLYLLLSLNEGLLSVNFKNLNLIIDLRLFMTIAMLFSLLGLAKSMLQAIDFLSDKAESAAPKCM
jgi:hypothetical protein